MTAEKQDKAKIDLKYKLNILKKIDSQKPKLDVNREGLLNRIQPQMSKNSSPISNKHIIQHPITNKSPRKNTLMEPRLSLERVTNSNPYD